MSIREKRAALETFWRELQVHPAAAKLPMMSDDEIGDLARDIEANGLQEPIILWRDNRAEAKGKAGPFPTYLLDGRNRMAALERLGIANPHQAPLGKVYGPSRVCTLNAVKMVSILGPRGGTKNEWVTDTDPVTFVLSMNVHRRHLTREQKREAIRAYIEADPSASNRKVARELKVSHVTVAAARDDVQGGQIDQSEQATDRAAAALRANPEMTQREVAEVAGVSLGTVSKASRKLKKTPSIPTAPDTGEVGEETPDQPTTKKAQRAVEDFGVRVVSLASFCRAALEAGIPDGIPKADAKDLHHELVGAHVALGKLMREVERRT